jgi:hypothetical protein
MASRTGTSVTKQALGTKRKGISSLLGRYVIESKLAHEAFQTSPSGIYPSFTSGSQPITEVK